MGSSFLITLREGLEISLVLAILISYLVKSNRSSEQSAVWLGSGIAALLCVALGLAFHLIAGGLNGHVEQSVEGVLATLAASVLTWMVFWGTARQGRCSNYHPCARGHCLHCRIA